MSLARRRTWLRRGLLLVAAVASVPVLMHVAALAKSASVAPQVTFSSDVPSAAVDDPARREVARSYARMRGNIREVRLAGSPSVTGAAHGKLLYDDQRAIESAMHDAFRHYVPSSLARAAIVDLARLRFGALDGQMSEDRRQEIAAQAAQFVPDPFASLMPTYPRFLYLHSLYDLLLAFEHSPLLGCTSFVLGPEATADGRTLVGRNFDFEGPSVLEVHKTVFLVDGDGPVPYATVSWPGFVGAATGMNREGVAIVVHGARAGEVRDRGAPVAHTVRWLLAHATTASDALGRLGELHPLVPHMLLVVDASGDAAVVERVPGHPPFVRRRVGPTLGLTNHLEGPHASDPKNERIRSKTSTLARAGRLAELLAQTGAARIEDAVALLRDRRARGGGELPLGHRSAIDALIATHAVVMDTTGRSLWVSEGPHALGRFVRFDLRELLDPAFEPLGAARVEAVPADPLLEGGQYSAWRERGAPHEGVE